MKQIERHNDPLLALETCLAGFQTKVWALPGIIQSFLPEAMTCVVQPAIEAFITDEQGKQMSVALPLLLDCPVQFPSGGGCTLTFPIQPGDECLLVFASRCIDAWWQSGGVQPQAELRMHDLSDGFVLPGFRSVPRAIEGISTSAAQLRSDDGATFVEVAPSGAITITAPAGLTINGDVQVNGQVTSTGDVKAGEISLQQHKTTGVTPGSGTSGVPTP